MSQDNSATSIKGNYRHIQIEFSIAKAFLDMNDPTSIPDIPQHIRCDYWAQRQA